jgi:hypothetical protein
MPFESIKTKMKFLFKKQNLNSEINQKTQKHIAPARGGITKCLQVHQPAKRGIEKIYYRQYKISGAM